MRPGWSSRRPPRCMGGQVRQLIYAEYVFWRTRFLAENRVPSAAELKQSRGLFGDSFPLMTRRSCRYWRPLEEAASFEQQSRRRVYENCLLIGRRAATNRGAPLEPTLSRGRHISIDTYRLTSQFVDNVIDACELTFRRCSSSYNFIDSWSLKLKAYKLHRV